MASWLEEIKRRKVLRVLGAYIVAAWVILQVADIVAPILDLPDWVPRLVLFLLVIGLVPAVILTWAYEFTPDGLRRDEDATSEDAETRRGSFRPGLSGAAVLLIGVAGTFAYWLSGADERWALDTALPALEAAIGTDDWDSAYATALQIQTRLPGSAFLDDYWARFSQRVEIRSEPSGATVYHRPYDHPESEMRVLGLTPIEEARLPRGISEVRFELDGYEPITRVVGGMPIDGTPRLAAAEHPTGTQYFIPAVDVVLDPATSDSISPDVRVPGTPVMIDGQLITLADFRVGRYEVTNREYLEFVESGGYQQAHYWEHEFIRDGEVLSLDEAMTLFVDATGQPGPSTWIGGVYPDGLADYPVGGISWYEAAAFARFAGRDLPTLHHWRRAHAEAMLSWQVPASNAGNDAVAPVGSYPSLGWTGTYDMAGNVREWCFNEIQDRRTIIGGAWDTLPYMVQDSITYNYALPPFDRSAQNGMRLATLNDERSDRLTLHEPIEAPKPLEPIPPASDEVFSAILRNFEQGDAPLRATIDAEKRIKEWTRQRISFDRGDDERAALYLYLPDSEPGRRHPTVVFWPSAIVFFMDEPLDDTSIDFLIRRGWAVAMPVLERTLHRRPTPPRNLTTLELRDVNFRRIRELRRTIDYLETRPDIDTEGLVYYGLSFGGWAGALALAVEPRLKIGVLNQAGLVGPMPYDVDPVHFLPRVHQPVLQLNGRYDTDYRYEDEANPFFVMLGSEKKKHVVEPTGHFVPTSIVIGETLAWLDEHAPTVR